MSLRLLMFTLVGFSVGDLPDNTVAWEALKLLFLLAVLVTAVRALRRGTL